jgi:hypothetical protein
MFGRQLVKTTHSPSPAHLLRSRSSDPVGANLNYPILDPHFEARERLICRPTRDFAGHRIEASAVHWTLDVATARKSGCNELKICMGARAVKCTDPVCRVHERDRASGNLHAGDISDAELIKGHDIHK